MTERDRPTEAERTNTLVRRHLAALVVVAQEGSSSDVVRMMRSEICRLVSAVCTVLNQHPIDKSGRCRICQSTTCALLNEVRRAIIPVQLGK